MKINISDMEEFITTKEARRITGCNVNEMRKLLNMGAIKAVRKENRGWLVERQSAEEFAKVLHTIVERMISERFGEDKEDE